MILCVDYGLKRIGLAVSYNGIMAQPLCVFENRGERKNIDRIHHIFESMHDIPQYIVVGSGFDGAIKFGEAMKNALKVPVFYQNEHFSSLEAEQYIRQTMDIHEPKKVKELLDAVAAAMILNDYLDSLKGGK